jgi:hypothetical protein
MTIRVVRMMSRFIGAMPMLALFALTSVPVAAADQHGGDLAVATGTKKILFAEEPAILIVIDGEPLYQQLEGTDLQRITNTQPFIVSDSAGIHYLKVLDGWMEAYGLYSRWSVAGVPPPGAEQALRQIAIARTIDLLDPSSLGEQGRRPRLDDATAPAIFISTTPAELIVMDGPPHYATVEGTSLEYVDNTTANVFREPTDGELYVLIGGRWFRSWTTDGPWEAVSRSDLPSDILAIPDGSPVWHGTRAVRAIAPR